MKQRQFFETTIRYPDEDYQVEGYIFATGDIFKDESIDNQIYFYVEDKEDMEFMKDPKNCGSEFHVISYEEIDNPFE